MKNYYQILGVSETATEQEIKKAFRRIAKDNHPDTHPGDRAAEARFKEANEAHETLSDTQKREKYDLERQNRPQAQKKKSPQAAGAPVDFAHMNFGDMFESMFQEMEQEKDAAQKVGKQKQKAEKDPLNVDDIFSKFMGFKP